MWIAILNYSAHLFQYFIVINNAVMIIPMETTNDFLIEASNFESLLTAWKNMDWMKTLIGTVIAV